MLGFSVCLKVVWGKLNNVMNLFFSKTKNSCDILFVFTVEAAIK